MSWAARRRLIIVGSILLVVVAILGIALYSTLYHAPSCVDGIQNQGEQGIDCGGPCAYLCQASESAPVVRYTQALATPTGRTDVIATIDNPNQGAYARGASYQVALYASDHTLAAPPITGTIDLPPGASVPLFIPNINTGNATVAQAFLTIDSSAIRWQAGTDTRVKLGVSGQVIGGTPSAPRITATLTNPSTSALSSIRVIVAVYDDGGNVIAASQTVVPAISGQGSATATFTWSAPFAATAARVEVMPLVPLP